MAYIAPNSTIKLYDNVPLDNSYRNTLYFPSSTDQLAYFHGGTAVGSAHAVATLEAQYYQRVSDGICRVEVPYGQAYAVSYMAFKNTSFENKWFYAFVTDVRYVNNQVVEISYEIDVMQSYFFDVEIKPCLVEREMIAKSADTVGANILPEHFELGEYVHTNEHQMFPQLSSCWIIIGITDDKSADTSIFNTVNNSGVFNARLPRPVTLGSTPIGSMYDRVYSGLTLYAFDASSAGAAEAAQFIDDHIKTVDNIHIMYMAPKAITPTVDSGTHLIGSLEQSTPLTAGEPAIDPATDTIGGYHPVNAKLFTYPYNYIEVSNGSGESLALRYEYFNDHPRFDVASTFMNPVTLTLRPAAYKGTAPATQMTTDQPLYTESISLSNYPLCSWTYDAYKRWSATRTPQIMRAGIVDAASAIPSLAGLSIDRQRNAQGQLGHMWFDYATGVMAGNRKQLQRMNAVNAGTNLISKAASIYEERYEASLAVDPVKGSTSNANADFSLGNLNFWVMRTHISEEVAQMVDEYFSVFGYKTNRVKVPNMNNRNIWNYVKTVNALIEKRSDGKVNASDISQMESIFDNGITFWHSAAEVGNYSRTNMINN